ncbi:MAG: immune inhibitor A domain-containing protein [Candidatus Edwardsbacteria bacterium]
MKKSIMGIVVLSMLATPTLAVSLMPPLGGVVPGKRIPKFPKGAERPNEKRASHLKVSGTWNALVILIDFPDYRWNHQADPNFVNADTPYTQTHFLDMLSSIGTYQDISATSLYTGSMRDFYLESSYNKFEVITTTTVWYMLAFSWNWTL